MVLESDIKPCPCCGNSDFFEVIGFKDIPISGIYRSNIDTLQAFIDLCFDVCLSCGLLRRRDFYSPPDYSNTNRSTEKQLPSYIDDLIRRINDVVKPNELIAEIGSNDGSFLRFIGENGYINTFGVEPSQSLAMISAQSGLRIHNAYFAPNVIDNLIANFGDVGLAICRHTLEHVPFPESFVAALRDLLKAKRGVAFIEVPDSAAITDLFNFMELWDEHLHYFTDSTLELLLNRHGFCVQKKSIYQHLDTRNLLVQAVVADIDTHKEFVKNTKSVSMWKRFSERFRVFSENFQREVAKLPRPIYFIGASHPQCNFANYLGIGEYVDFMIDDDLEKVGKYPPISSSNTHIITSNQFLSSPNEGTIVLTAFGYSNWTNRLVEEATRKSMKIVDPKSFVES